MEFVEFIELQEMSVSQKKSDTAPIWDGRRIKSLRKKMNLSQEEMAAILGTRQQTISEWEVGLYEPRGTSVRLLELVAERAGFEYQATPPTAPPEEGREKREEGRK